MVILNPTKLTVKMNYRVTTIHIPYGLQFGIGTLAHLP